MGRLAMGEPSDLASPSVDKLATEEEAAKAALRASPLVKDIGDIPGARKGVYARLWCVSCHPKRDSEQLNITKARSDRAACARDLLVLINEKHSNSQCVEAAETARAAAAAEAGPSAPTDAFQAMQAARLVVPAVAKAEAAERLVAEALQARASLEAQLATANAALEAKQAELRRLEEEADAAREAAGLPRKKQRGEEADAEPTYRSWTLSKWNELETKEQRRREVEIDSSRTAIEAPPGGDDTRSWHNHWRRGVYGALRSWAGGSQGAVVYMLAAATKAFGVEAQVCAKTSQYWSIHSLDPSCDPSLSLPLPCLHSLASISADAGA